MTGTPTSAETSKASTKEAAQLTAAAVRLNWHRLSITIAINHACVTTPLIYATSLLNEKVGYYGSALLYISTCLSSLFVSIPVVMTVGPRSALFLSMLLYSAYVGLFALATVMNSSPMAQGLVFLPASCLGGIAASMLWTSQGGYLGRSVSALVETSQCDLQSATSKHASIFAVYYLMFEVAFKLFSSVALQLNFRPWIIFTVCLVCGIGTSFGTFTLLNYASAPGAKRPSACAKLTTALKLWRDPAIWCLSPTNLAFGFSAAFLNGYVNATYTKVQLGKEFVGYFSTITAFLAAVFSQLFGMAAVRLGQKGPFVLIGSVCFLAIPALVLIFGLDGWHYALIVPYILQGCGRAVYESTNKGIFADFFPGAASEGAFANQMMQSTLSFTLAFFFSASLPRSALAGIIVALAGVTFPGLLLAHHLRRGRRTEEAAAGDCA
mmetsp:Transcript_68643/g.200890  ORF Transcript_68643/g.200890 Transcript_68643/m.200890 type:complete len:438 (-) Transcript_68643:135-1448(-)